MPLSHAPAAASCVCSRRPYCSQTLYTFDGDFRAFKAHIAAQYNGITITRKTVNIAAGETKTPEFLAKSPLGKVPVLETESGTSCACVRLCARCDGLWRNGYQPAIRLRCTPRCSVCVLSVNRPLYFDTGCVFESNAIARYIARTRRDTELYGVTFFESGLVDGWLDFASHDLELPISMWLYPVLGYAEFNQEVCAALCVRLRDYARVAPRSAPYQLC